MGAEVVETTALGLRYPNGAVDWANDDGVLALRDGAATIRVQLSCEDGECQDLLRILSSRAAAAHIELESFLGMHEIVSRTVTVTTSGPTTVSKLDTLLQP